MEQINVEVKDNQELINIEVYVPSSGGGSGVTKHSQLVLDDGTNPHGTTKTDVGLGNVDNTSDLNKPISNATQLALDTKLDNTTPTISPTQAAAIVVNTAKVSFPEAPVDGKLYARINGAWQEVSASLDKAYTDTVNIPAASGTVNIDFSLGIHFNITLTGNTTLTFSNYLPYKSVKVQTLQIKSASAAHTLALPAGVTFTTAIDLSATTKNNFLSVNILDTDLFQCANLVKTIV